MLRKAIMAAGLAAAIATMSVPAAAGAEHAVGVDYIVVLRDGIDARQFARRHGVRPEYVYSNALSGFAAPLTQAQVNELENEREVVMVALDDPDPSSARRQPLGSTPIEQSPQQAPRGIRRIGTLQSPTAAIDGIDRRVNVDIAIIDSGIQPDQPDLNVVGGVACHAGRGFDDADYHGTMVAGVAAAIDNSFGVVGVAPGARLWAVRVQEADGLITRKNVLCGIDWVTKNKRVIDVVNMSLGEVGTDDGRCGRTVDDPVHWAICGATRQGIPFVVAAGNDFSDAGGFNPASYDEVITVSAMSDSDGSPGGSGPATCIGSGDDVFAPFSNFGQDIDIAAPGVCVGSTFPGSGLAIDSGTSFAAPHVTGAAALYLSQRPNTSPRELKRVLRQLRERTALPGDPDGLDEGILNVSQL